MSISRFFGQGLPMKPIRNGFALAALAAGQPALAAPGDMSVATYLVRAEALQAKGMTAMFSSEIGVLRDEVTASGAAFRARIAGEKAAGKALSACPPQKMGMNSNILLAHLRTYPLAARARVSMKMALADWIVKNHPCR